MIGDLCYGVRPESDDRDSSGTAGWRTKDNKPSPSLLDPGMTCTRKEGSLSQNPLLPPGPEKAGYRQRWKLLRIPSHLISASSQMRSIWS